MSGNGLLDAEKSSRAVLSDATRLGGVALTVTDLERSIAFYADVLGLQVQRREPGVVALGGGGEELVMLHENPSARQPGREAGVYHVALLFPTREDLARVALRLAASRTPIDGASDHGVSEAIYLPDPDGIGVELAADRPQARWAQGAAEEFQRGGPAPLDVGNLLDSVAGEEPAALAPEGLSVGHVHLHVGSLDEGLRFYRDAIGFEVQMELPSALFVSAGGYHHHVGFNVWRGRGVPPAGGTNVIGLRHWTLVLDGDEELGAVRSRLTALDFELEEREDGLIARDPANIAVRITS
ncbi:MAG TPA: VOC family protein [Solirubrobacteraceae bacterium]|nr:VOC family protein [Solirubrobacteraceae bacterium]